MSWRITPSLVLLTLLALAQTPPREDTVRVRFITAKGSEVVIQLAQNPTAQGFLALLPLTLEFRDFNRMEKIAYLPRRLPTQGSPSHTPKNGDLIYFVPWGNIGFFYNVARRDPSFDDRLILIGQVERGFENLSDLEVAPVRVERVR
ncbi:MAG: cyclophilin-like fold protein [Meiothermus sp.]|uniref:cyclophilin-like fold protein n=1 Tax=Thermaceae TaxID=188786 RepID=UPI00261AF0E8|nr:MULTISPECIES: cyclophilin-like fold protein [Thermaceae]MCS7057992.1 cyclophilin-like fold protein [Meiothermus sp.]MDW8016424.1 cyclophilin-like fold protein [Thermus sp.]MDW8480404.1 cyclophilin-like fold protein [Meiothermus sp.]